MPGRPPGPSATGRRLRWITIARLAPNGPRPVLVLGSDVWLGGAEDAPPGRPRRSCRLPVIANGQARGVLPRGHELLVSPGQVGAPCAEADLVIVAGTPLDFRRWGTGRSARRACPGPGGARGRRAGRHRHARPAGRFGVWRPGRVLHRAGGGRSPGPVLEPILEAGRGGPGVGAGAGRGDPGRAGSRRAAAGQRGRSAVHPARIYGELLKRRSTTTRWSSATAATSSRSPGKFIEPLRPGGWLDPGPFGCLGTGLGYAIAARARLPGRQVVLLLGDGAAGFWLMDAGHAGPARAASGHDLRQQLGTGAWSGIRCAPCTATTSPPTCSQAAVTTRWSAPSAAPASWSPRPRTSVRRCAAPSRPASPYLVNVVTDPEAVYPRSTTGV